MAWCTRNSTRCLSVAALSSSPGACSSPFWQLATRFLQPIHNALFDPSELPQAAAETLDVGVRRHREPANARPAWLARALRPATPPRPRAA